MNFTKIFSQVGKIQVKSITDSAFKYSLLFFVLAIVCAVASTTVWLVVILAGIGILLALMGIVYYIYFARTNPDYLRSETFQLKKQSIELLGDKDNFLNPNAKSVVQITGPLSNDMQEGKSLEDPHD